MGLDHDRSKNSSTDTPLNKLSRKPNKQKSDQTSNSEIQKKNEPVQIETSDIESSINSVTPPSDIRQEESKTAKSIDKRNRTKAEPKSLNEVNSEQKEILLNNVVSDWIDKEISDCVQYFQSPEKQA